MKKLGLISLAFAAIGFATVGCTSNQSAETAQATQPTTQTDASIAQAATTEMDTQNGVAVQADPSVESAEPIQAVPAEGAEAPQVVE
ncbi:molybdenum ABC transporter substrate-binding protein [Acinetobacter sp. YH16032]|uniref:molybdenum ABC transporter substrate-binding protein n=1 Tax=Acinetobacter sp. YH16032 TaxID=2601181 RepID=UPI0015D24AFA|nr:molybdenum ABC transporter substrate-binding protein [Acinetobacter sp. YH16032]